MGLTEDLGTAKEKGFIILIMTFLLKLFESKHFKQVMIFISLILFAIVTIFLFKFELKINPFKFSIEKEIFKIEDIKKISKSK